MQSNSGERRGGRGVAVKSHNLCGKGCGSNLYRNGCGNEVMISVGRGVAMKSHDLCRKGCGNDFT